MKTTRLSRFALLTFLAAGSTLGDTIFHSDSGTISGDGAIAGSLFATPYTVAFINGTTSYFFRGDLTIPSGAALTVQGSRPVRVIVGGDLYAPNASVNVSAQATPQAGGGWGGQGGPGGTGAYRGSDSNSNGNTPSGGVGGVPVFCVFANGSAGHYGFSGTYLVNSNGVSWGGSSGHGWPGTLGFAQSFGNGAAGDDTPGGNGGNNGFAGGGGPGGNGGEGNYGFGNPGYPGSRGGDGGPGSNGADGWRGNPGYRALFGGSSGDLFAGSGGGGGAGGSGGGAGGNGGIGGTGGGGGGGGATSCVAGGRGGDGGYGGYGSGGGWGGTGAPGASGGHGAGAIELASLGRLTFGGWAGARGGDASVPQTWGSPGQYAGSGGSGGNGYPGQLVGGSAGRGGDGGGGGYGGTGGRGGNGGGGGFAGGGGGGTIKFNAAEVSIGLQVDVLGGADSPRAERADPGVFYLAFNQAPYLSYSLANNGGHGPGLTIQAQGPSDPNPYFASGTNSPYLAGLEGGGAIAGIVPNIRADQVVNPASVPVHTVAAVALVTSVPGILGLSPAKPGVVLVNLGDRPLAAPAFGLGAAAFTNTVRRFGWANDPRFGGSGPQPIATLAPGQVYLTMIPSGSSISIATLSATYQGASRIISSADFSFVSPLTLIVAPCSADFNADNVVDDADFAAFATAYNILDCLDPLMPVGCPADINADAFVDDSDFVLFADAYNALLCP
jgi:hypothetical protein